MQTGELRERFAFGELQKGDGAGGNTRTGPFEDQFEVWAKETPINVGEEVMAGRVQGVRTVLITVRYSTETRQITGDWCARNVNTKEQFAISEAKDPDGRKQWIEILARTNVAGGGVAGEQSL